MSQNKINEKSTKELNENYKIIKLSISNLKKIDAIDVTPKGNTVMISGKNGQGKSTVLDAIEYALTGKIPEDVIQHGKEKSNISIDIGEYTIEKVITQKNKYLKVKDGEGNELKNPQSFLDNIVGNSNIAFDPFEFTRLKETEQKDLFLKIRGIDLTEIDNEYNEKYNQRTVENRLLKNLEVKVNSYTNIEKVEKVEVSELLEEINIMDNKKRVFDNYSKRKNELSQKINQKEAEIERLKIELEELIKELKSIPEYIDSEITTINKIISDIQTKIKDSEKTNEKYNKYQEYEKVKTDYDSQKAIVENINADMEDNRKKKAELLQNAKLGNLYIDESGELSYKGYKINNISQSEKIRIGFSIATLLNPSIRVCLIRDGSLLDNETMQAVEKFSKEYNIQAWIEIVDNSDNAEEGLCIFDGSENQRESLFEESENVK